MNARALSHATASRLVEPERIKAEQLGSGETASAGQIVEIERVVEGAVKSEMALLATGEATWVLALFKEH